MQLLDLSAEELAFLAGPAVAPAGLAPRLTRRLAATLSARLRMPVHTTETGAPCPDVPGPHWQPDDALAALWLTRRLGGRHVAGRAAGVPRGLLRTLDEVLAEVWLDAPVAAPVAALPSCLAWQIGAGAMRSLLTLALPTDSRDMTRWAREVIRHG
ncbi:MAG: hypothetical protein ACYC5S_04590 [Thiobacillus sp.]